MLLVETTGPHQLVTNRSRLVIRSRGYTVVPRSADIDVWQVQRKLRLVAEVNDQATDKEWLEYVRASDGDLALAKEAFVSAYPVGGGGKPRDLPELISEPAPIAPTPSGGFRKRK